MTIQTKMKKDFPLAPLTTFKIGGPAKFYLEIENKDELESAYDWAARNNENVFVLGGGSNVLINDKGAKGLVLKLSNSDIGVQEEKMVCGAGASLQKVVITSAGQGLSGLEWAAGIPGTIGGAIYGNAGAFGSEIAQAVETVEVFNVRNKKFAQFNKNDCQFDYRSSIFKTGSDLLVWSAVLILNRGNEREIHDQIRNNINLRIDHQPRLPSAGSIFKNVLLEDLKRNNPILAQRAEDDGAVKSGKLAAGWLIEQLDLKGKSIGGAKISLEHANFIVNTGGAKADEVIMLISYVKQQVRDILKVQLREEVRYFGF